MKKSKASMIDVPVGLCLVFVFGFMIVMGQYIYNEVNDTDVFADSTEAQTAFERTDATLGIMDYIFLVMIVAVGFGAIVAAAVVKSHPLFIIPVIMIAAGFIMVFGMLSNAYGDISENTTLSTAADDFPLIDLGMDNFVIIFVVLMFFAGVIMFSKDGGGETVR